MASLLVSAGSAVGDNVIHGDYSWLLQELDTQTKMGVGTQKVAFDTSNAFVLTSASMASSFVAGFGGGSH